MWYTDMHVGTTLTHMTFETLRKQAHMALLATQYTDATSGLVG